MTLPLWLVPDMWGTDLFANEIRLLAYSRCLIEGHLWPDWLLDLAHGHGYPFFHYYAALLYVLAGPLHVMGLEPRAALLVVLSAAIAVGAVVVCSFIKRRFGTFAGVAASLLWLSAPYLHVDLQVRQAWTELLGLCILPVALSGVLDIAEGMDEIGARMRATLGLIGVMLSHNVTALVTMITIMAVSGLMLCYQRDAVKRTYTIMRSVFVAIGVTAFFWLPALMDLGMVSTERMFSSPWSPYEHAVYPAQLLSMGFGRGPATPGPDDQMNLSPGVVHVLAFSILLVLALVRARILGRLGWTLVLLAVSIIVSMLPPVVSVLAEFGPYRVIQFPFRLLGPLSIILAWAIPILASRLLPLKLFRPILALVVVGAMLSIAPAFSGFRTMSQEEKTVVEPIRQKGVDGIRLLPDPWATTTWAMEYLPQSVVAYPEEPSPTVEAPPWIHIEDLQTGCSRITAIGKAEQPGVIRFSSFDFEGAKVSISDREVVHGHDRQTGFVIAFIEKTGPFDVTLEYGPTPASLFGRGISILTLFIVLALRKYRWLVSKLGYRNHLSEG